MNDDRIAFYAALIACEGIAVAIMVAVIRHGASPWLGAVAAVVIGTLASLARRSSA